MNEAVGEGAELFVVKADFDLATFDEQFRHLSDALAEGGEVVSTLPGMEASAPDRITFRIVYASWETRAEVAARAAPAGATLVESGAKTAAAAGLTPAAESGGEEGDAPSAPAPSAASLTMLVRVPLDELDDLISSTHELLTDTAAALDLSLAGDLSRPARTEMEIRAARIRRRFFELEERLIELRMIPVGRTLERAARAGAGAARVAGREVEFETTGGGVRLDTS
ncbi:MAG: hypothetical protein ACRD68_14480, partial [Pyrinomonadaceae bacterium]